MYMEDQIKQAFKSGWLANHQGKNMPESYVDRIVDNAFKQWEQDIVKKPLSELTKEDAIEIAKAATIHTDWEAFRQEGHMFLTTNYFSIPQVWHLIIGFDDEFRIKSYQFYTEGNYPTQVNVAKATDKARELGYDI